MGDQAAVVMVRSPRESSLPFASPAGVQPPYVHAFELMDVERLPRTLRHTLRDILECGNGLPFRGYYDLVARAVVEVAQRSECEAIVELGAGTAPITARVAAAGCGRALRLIAADRDPDRRRLAALRRRRPEVEAIEAPMDIEAPSVPPGSVVVLSACLHHVHRSQRRAALETLRRAAAVVVVAEPLRRTWLSVLFVFLSVVPALFTPLRFALREGRWRRVLWCWLLPVAPILFVWDGVVSCLRQWSAQEWAETRPSSSIVTPVSVVATYVAERRTARADHR